MKTLKFSIFEMLLKGQAYPLNWSWEAKQTLWAKTPMQPVRRLQVK